MNASVFPGLDRFLARPWDEKWRVISRRLKSAWCLALSRTRVPIVKRFDPGFFWIISNDVIRDGILAGTFEAAERVFVERFVQPGMTVLDIGAYHGLYTLIASRRTGDHGRVIAFEPSLPQMRRLKSHLKMNRCKNVCTESMALGDRTGESEFFFAKGGLAGYSSLRPPKAMASTQRISVPITTLDAYLERNLIGCVDFIKADVEGAELDLFRGATRLLRGTRRPVILCELQDVRTEAWGHKASDVAEFLSNFGFKWYQPTGMGKLERLRDITHGLDGNYVAVPDERIAEIKEITEDGRRD